MKDPRALLLVEDNDQDAELISMTVEKNFPDIRLERVQDGMEAMEILQRNNEIISNLAFILLDIKMPKMNGIEILSWIKNNSRLKFIPVVMFSSSKEPRDLQACYSAGANAYVVKPVDFNEFKDTLCSINKFWCNINVRPQDKT
jgi:CheY-like chemotaxis protein